MKITMNGKQLFQGTTFITLILCISMIFLVSPTSAGRGEDMVAALYKAGHDSTAENLQIELNYVNTFPHPLPPEFRDHNITSNNTFTFFSPVGKEISLGISDHILRYHIARVRLDKETLESSLPLGSEIKSLLCRLPLVLTSTGHANVSIDGVKISQWNIYQDETVIIHGVESALYTFYDWPHEHIDYDEYGGFEGNIENRNNSWKPCNDDDDNDHNNTTSGTPYSSDNNHTTYAEAPYNDNTNTAIMIPSSSSPNVDRVLRKPRKAGGSFPTVEKNSSTTTLVGLLQIAGAALLYLIMF